MSAQPIIDEKQDIQHLDPELPQVVHDVDKVGNVVQDASLEAVGGIRMTPEEKILNRRVNLKMDLHLLPAINLMYLFDSLDRNNIGNAATVQFTADIGATPVAVNNAVTLFFITFVTCMPAYVWLGKKFGMTRFIPATMFLWGLLTLCNGFIKTYGQLLALRLLIGICESGWYPAIVYYFSSCYTRYDLGLRVALLYGAVCIGGACSGLIAYGVLQLKGALHGWQYLFIIDGGITMLIATFAFFYLPRHIGTAWFLNDRERAWAVERLARDSGGQDYSSTKITKQDWKDTMKDWKLFWIWLVNLSVGVQSTAVSIFLPLIVQSLGYESWRADLYAVPIYAVAIFTTQAICFSSDHFKERTYHFLVANATVIVGLAMTTKLENAHARYAGLCILQIGNWACQPLMVTLLANNTPNHGHRALALAFNGMNNLSGIIGGQLYRPQFKPTYKIPFACSLAFASFASAITACLRFSFMRINKWRANKVMSMSPEEIAEENEGDTRRSDKKWTYQYTL